MKDNQRIDQDRASERVPPISEWIMATALTDFEPGELLGGMIERMREAGLPIDRVHLAHRVLHPIYNGGGLTWRESTGVEPEDYLRADAQSDVWMKSPIRHMLKLDRRVMRLRIGEGEGVAAFPIIATLYDEGVNDYVAIMTPFGDPHTASEREAGILVSWSTCDPAGWSEQDIVDIEALQRRFAVAFRAAVRQSLAQTVVAAYLGTDAGNRVLDGQIARGDGEDIDAVVCFADLRSSTRLAEELGRDRFLALLNEFFECTAIPIQQAGGEILNYIGDAVLAIFSFERFGGPDGACRAALDTARAIERLVADSNARREGETDIHFGIGLHPGRVMFGNIGIPTRLAFSVIGSTVNEAARITDMCRALRESIVVSEEFRRQVDTEWRDVGVHELRNVSQAVRLYAPG